MDRWGELRTNQFATIKILGRVDELAGLLDEAQARNYRRWNILGRQVYPNHFTGRSYEDEVQYTKSWIERRLQWIDHQFLAGTALTLAEPGAAAKSKITMRSPAGKTYYTLDGSDPRAAGGAVSANAQLYRGPLAVSRDIVVTARVLEGNRWSWPTKAKMP